MVIRFIHVLLLELFTNSEKFSYFCKMAVKRSISFVSNSFIAYILTSTENRPFEEAAYDYLINLQTIHEAIVNTVTHRNYMDNSCVQVCIYDDDRMLINKKEAVIL